MMTPFQKVRRGIEEDLLEYAKRHAHVGETAEQALVRLIDARDPDVTTMYEAAGLAKSLDERQDRPAMVAKRNRAMALMQDCARAAKRADETHAQAFARLLATNDAFQSTYEYYLEQAPW